ncbi:PadR family transcriptional regulator [Oceanobacillus jeddahense]|uniref:PadR family transcriptional regulator n=1 Tax=Oceanobacillus jeddahense TaxID=1462527 RepID=A0ABY5JN23_9BACI|nr:PadR family transcriptional regulator [Oceanobacillus jeddahense]UUI01219.1 PadR family transcriptional regulator [Oceanobacillus jeddahense]
MMTRLLVLCMLDAKPMSGYDIQQALRMTDAERWGGILIGSIYHALKKLEKDGFITIDKVEQTGHRQKFTYRITEEGKEHLKELIREALTASSVQYPSSLYAGISFFEKLPAEEARQALEQQRAALENEYKSVETGWQEKNAALEGNIPPMVQLVFDNMFATIRLQQDFVEKALAYLEDNN